jgi:hypothetical protein
MPASSEKKPDQSKLDDSTLVDAVAEVYSAPSYSRILLESQLPRLLESIVLSGLRQDFEKPPKKYVKDFT